jgi:Zn-dependent protease
MFGKGLKLGKIYGIEVGLDYSWFLIFAFVTWRMSTMGVLTVELEGPLIWLAGLSVSILFFSSVLAHEFGHSIVAIRSGIPVKSITLFLFGGVARIVREPERPLQEFWIAIAGPVVSLLLGGLFGLISVLLPSGSIIGELAFWLAFINVMLAIFNMIPGFPMDGGRVLRAIIWAISGKFILATKIASWIGRGVAVLFIAGGVWLAVDTEQLSGLWLSLIGSFLLVAATSSVKQTLQRQIIGRYRALDLIHNEIPTIECSVTLDRLIEEVFLRQGNHIAYVTDGEITVGLVTLREVSQVPIQSRTTTLVDVVMTPLSEIEEANSEENLLVLLDDMTTKELPQVRIVQNGQFEGIITQDQLMNFIQMQLQLGYR